MFIPTKVILTAEKNGESGARGLVLYLGERIQEMIRDDEAAEKFGEGDPEEILNAHRGILRALEGLIRRGDLRNRTP